MCHLPESGTMLLQGRTKRGLGADSVVRDPLIALGENVPLPGVQLEEGILPVEGQKTWWAPLSGYSTAGERGTH